MNFRWFYCTNYMHKPHNIFVRNPIVLYALFLYLALFTLTTLSRDSFLSYNSDRQCFLKRLILRKILRFLLVHVGDVHVLGFKDQNVVKE